MIYIEFITAGILYLLGGFLFFNCCYLLFFSLAGHLKVKPLKVQALNFAKICVLIPDYKEDIVILETSKKALEHKYSGIFDVFVIADGLKAETITTLKNQGAKVIEVQFEKSTKGKALLHTLNVLPVDEYNIAIVLDVDNIMDEGFLEAVNKAFTAGYKVVQTHRTAKNMDTTFAFLDACNEEINNHIFRKGHFALGMSPSLIGSGMAFDYKYLKNLLSGIGETVGEDKEIDFRILKDQEKICYLNHVYVFDEKIENAKAFTQQRARWISTQLEYLRKYAYQGFIQLFRTGNIELFDKVVQSFVFPRILLSGVLLIYLLLSYSIPFGPGPAFSLSLLGVFVTAMLMAIPRHLLFNKKIGKAIVSLPNALLCMCLALFKINKTKSSFMPTPHKAKSVSSQIK